MLNNIKEWFCKDSIFAEMPDSQEPFRGVEIIDDPIPLFIRKIGEKIIEKGEVTYKPFTDEPTHCMGILYRCELLLETPQVVFEFCRNMNEYALTVDGITQDLYGVPGAKFLVNNVIERLRILNEQKTIKRQDEMAKKLEERKPLEKAIEQW